MELCADVSKTSKSIVEIYVFASEHSHWPLLENVVAYHVMNYCSGDIDTESAFLDILILYILSTVAQALTLLSA